MTRALIGKTNLTVASRPPGGTLVGKTNVAVASRPPGAWAVIGKTNLMVSSQEAPAAPLNYRGIRAGAQVIANIFQGNVAIGRVYRGEQLLYRK